MWRMRTIEQAAQYFKEIDAHTALSESAIRRFVTTGIIPSVRVGSKYLVALEEIDSYLSNGKIDIEACNNEE